MIEALVRFGFALVLIYMGVRGFTEFKRGAFPVENNDKAPIVLLRSERPFAFWSAVLGFYAVLLVILAAVIFAPRV